MYQRKNTPSISTLQYCQHTREYLKGARSGKGTTGSVLGTSPFLTEASTGAGTKKTGAAANHEGRGQGTRDRHQAPNTGTESKQAQDQEPDTQTDDQAERQPPGQAGKFSAGGTSTWTLRPSERRGVSDQLRPLRPTESRGVSDQLRLC